MFFLFFFQAEDGIRDSSVTGVQTCALPICLLDAPASRIQLPGGAALGRGVAGQAVLGVVGPAFHAGAVVAGAVAATGQVGAEGRAAVGGRQGFRSAAADAVAVDVIGVGNVQQGVACACRGLGAAGFASHATGLVVAGAGAAAIGVQQLGDTAGFVVADAGGAACPALAAAAVEGVVLDGGDAAARGGCRGGRGADAVALGVVAVRETVAPGVGGLDGPVEGVVGGGFGTRALAVGLGGAGQVAVGVIAEGEIGRAHV